MNGPNPSDPAWIYAEYRNYEPNLASHLETFSHDDGEVELYITEFNVDAPVPAESRSSDPIIIHTHDRNDILVVMVDNVIFKLDNNNPPGNAHFRGKEIQLHLRTNADITGSFAFYYRMCQDSCS